MVLTCTKQLLDEIGVPSVKPEAPDLLPKTDFTLNSRCSTSPWLRSRSGTKVLSSRLLINLPKPNPPLRGFGFSVKSENNIVNYL